MVIFVTTEREQPTKDERDEPVKIELDPDEALRAIMATGPHPDHAPVEQDEPVKDQGDALSE
jgi:hypothetical protein